jgi:hypothetical protein
VSVIYVGGFWAKISRWLKIYMLRRPYQIFKIQCIKFRNCLRTTKFILYHSKSFVDIYKYPQKLSYLHRSLKMSRWNYLWNICTKYESWSKHFTKAQTKISFYALSCSCYKHYMNISRLICSYGCLIYHTSGQFDTFSPLFTSR